MKGTEEYPLATASLAPEATNAALAVARSPPLLPSNNLTTSLMLRAAERHAADWMALVADEADGVCGWWACCCCFTAASLAFNIADVVGSSLAKHRWMRLDRLVGLA